MVTETKNSSLAAAPSKTPAGWATVSHRWGFAAIAIAAVALAAWPTVVVARGTQLTTAHRAAAAWTTLLTLMGVSASGYAANKIVSTKVNTQEAPAADNGQ